MNKYTVLTIILIILMVGIGGIIYFNYNSGDNSQIAKTIRDYTNPVVDTFEDSINKVTDTINSVSMVGTDEVVSDLESKIHEFTNKERLNYGIHALQYDSKLSAISKAHSKDMADNNFFDHTNLQGLSPSDRTKKAGYQTYKSLGSGVYTEGIGENIFKMPYGDVVGSGYVGKYDSEKLATEIIKGWMESPGHRKNILDSSYSNIGVGVVFDGRYYYVTQNFW